MNEYWEHQEKAKWDQIDRETMIQAAEWEMKHMRKATAAGGPTYADLNALESEINALVRRVAKDGGLPDPGAYQVQQ